MDSKESQPSPEAEMERKNFAVFREQMLENYEVMSRTSRGISDISASPDKPKLAAEGASLADAAISNLEQAIEYIWEHRKDELTDPEAVKQFVAELSQTVSAGLLAEGQSPWRTWQTKFEIQSPPERIEADLEGFYQEFASRLADGDDPVKFAAWVEKRFDGEIHPLADGCGRTTKLISAMALSRHNYPLPRYTNRNEYYTKINSSQEDWQSYYRTQFEEKDLMSADYNRMLELVKLRHADQRRDGGQAPYWEHCERVGARLQKTLEEANEGNATQRRTLVLGGLGHDLYEDTGVSRQEIVRKFGSEVDELIEGASNRNGDKLDGMQKYAERLAKGPENTRLTKLADLTDNYWSGAYSLAENGPEWTNRFLWPVLETQWKALQESTYQDFPQAGKLLEQEVATARKQLMTALEQEETDR